MVIDIPYQFNLWKNHSLDMQTLENPKTKLMPNPNHYPVLFSPSEHDRGEI
jgi:hypothetical protein